MAHEGAGGAGPEWPDAYKWLMGFELAKPKNSMFV
jgi:hypothetical protein